MIARALNTALARFDRRLQCDSTYRMIDQERLALRELFTHAGAAMPADDTIEGIVFSKDRPLQLHALLASYLRHAADPVPLHIIYRSSSEAHTKAYHEVFQCFSGDLVRPYEQTDFQADVINRLEAIRAGRVIFLVDDIVFIAPFAFSAFRGLDPLRYIPTLRLGRGLSECYTRSQPQAEPSYRETETNAPDLIAWRWKDGEHDYGFPLSVDGQIYDCEEIAIIARHTSFTSPNLFENALQLFHESFSERSAVAYETARLVNVPLNRVQEEWDSRNAGVSQDSLLNAWRDGMCWNIAALDGYRNRSTHEEIDLQLEPR